jgi:hypothetical protein
MHQNLGEEAVRRILGVLNLTKKYGVASTDEACAMGLETGASNYHFVRRYLERNLATESAPGRSADSATHSLSRPHRKSNAPCGNSA